MLHTNSTPWVTLLLLAACTLLLSGLGFSFLAEVCRWYDWLVALHGFTELSQVCRLIWFCMRHRRRSNSCLSCASVLASQMLTAHLESHLKPLHLRVSQCSFAFLQLSLNCGSSLLFGLRILARFRLHGSSDKHLHCHDPCCFPSVACLSNDL